MRSRKTTTLVRDARKSVEGAEQARLAAAADAAESAIDHTGARDWGAVFEAKRKALNEAADVAYKARLTSYESDEPDADWLVEDVLRWNREHGISLPLPGDSEISEAQDNMATTLAAAIGNLPPDTRWKPDASTPVLNSDPETAPRASRELADRVTRYFEEHPSVTYVQAARDLNVSGAAIAGAKRRVLEECTLTGVEPPAWVTRTKGWRQRPDARIRVMSNSELLAAMRAAKDGADE